MAGEDTGKQERQPSARAAIAVVEKPIQKSQSTIAMEKMLEANGKPTTENAETILGSIVEQPQGTTAHNSTEMYNTVLKEGHNDEQEIKLIDKIKKPHYTAAEMAEYLKKRAIEQEIQQKQSNTADGATQETLTPKTAEELDHEFRKYIDELPLEQQVKEGLTQSYERSGEAINREEAKVSATMNIGREELDQEIEAALTGKPPETPEQKQERLWKEEPFTAALNSAVDIINSRILKGEGNPLTAADILYDENFTLTADFDDKTSSYYQEKWRLIIDNKQTKDGKTIKRVAMRNLSGHNSGRFNYDYVNKHDHFYNGEWLPGPQYKVNDNGWALLEGNTFKRYDESNNKAFFGIGWDNEATSYDVHDIESYDISKQISKMRECFDYCINKPDKVELKKWKSPHLEQRMKETR
jgi:hypothetical protein